MMGITHDDQMHEPLSRGIAFLRQDVGHMRKIREYELREAKLEAMLQLAVRVLIDGQEIERLSIAKQIKCLLDHQEATG